MRHYYNHSMTNIMLEYGIQIEDGAEDIQSLPSETGGYISLAGIFIFLERYLSND
jgi:hypothetical protein